MYKQLLAHAEERKVCQFKLSKQSNKPQMHLDFKQIDSESAQKRIQFWEESKQMQVHVQQHEAVEKTLIKIVNDETSFIGKRTRIDTTAAASDSDSFLGKRKNKDA